MHNVFSTDIYNILTNYVNFSERITFFFFLLSHEKNATPYNKSSFKWSGKFLSN